MDHILRPGAELVCDLAHHLVAAMRGVCHIFQAIRLWLTAARPGTAFAADPHCIIFMEQAASGHNEDSASYLSLTSSRILRTRSALVGIDPPRSRTDEGIPEHFTRRIPPANRSDRPQNRSRKIRSR